MSIVAQGLIIENLQAHDKSVYLSFIGFTVAGLSTVTVIFQFCYSVFRLNVRDNNDDVPAYVT